MHQQRLLWVKTVYQQFAKFYAIRHVAKLMLMFLWLLFFYTLEAAIGLFLKLKTLHTASA